MELFVTVDLVGHVYSIIKIVWSWKGIRVGVIWEGSENGIVEEKHVGGWGDIYCVIHRAYATGSKRNKDNLKLCRHRKKCTLNWYVHFIQIMTFHNTMKVRVMNGPPQLHQAAWPPPPPETNAISSNRTLWHWGKVSHTTVVIRYYLPTNTTLLHLNFTFCFGSFFAPGYPFTMRKL